MKMKTYKAVLKSSLVMLVLFAVAGSGVAQAQTCQARAINAAVVRAEGITEMVGDIELQCRRATDDTGSFFDATIPDTLDITVRLNTNITNDISDARVVFAADGEGSMGPPGYQNGGILLDADQLDMELAAGDSILAANFGDGELTEDGDAIEWTDIPTSASSDLADLIMDENDINFDSVGAEDEQGFNLLIRGIRANASMVGDGEDITATVLVGGTAVHSAPLKVADVTTGLEVKADVVEGLQCADTDDAMSTITIQEGFANAIISMAPADDDADPPASTQMQLDTARNNSDSLLVTFTGIPEGVTVMVPAMVAVGLIDDPTEGALVDAPMVPDPAAFSLMLVHGNRTDGVEDVEDGMGAVELTSSGTGEVVYNVGMTSSEVNEEWVKLTVTFVWAAGGEMPAGVGSGYVDVSFSPVSNIGGDTFEDGGAKLPRFVASNDPDMVVNVGDCTTTLLFPFVTNQHTFDTGLVITNTSEEAAGCTIEYNGANAPDDLMSQPIAGGAQWIDVVSRIAQGFQGYITATCGFRDGYGFAFITDGYGVGTPELAQGYLAVCTSGAHCD